MTESVEEGSPAAGGLTQIAPGPFEPTWESLASYTAPDWYVDGKLGIFVHWGVYSVPAFGNEWYPRNMYRQGSKEFEHHVATYGPQSQFGYKDFIPGFKADKFSADEWAELFRKSGARYVVPVAEHHDGFAMYDSGFSKWCAAKMGPERDVIGQLAEAVRDKGMVFGASTHRAEHWWFMNGGREFESDVQNPEYADLYGPAESEETQPTDAFLEDWLARTIEIVDKYRPRLIYFDWWIEKPAFKPYLQRFAAHFYNRGAEWNQGVAINYKNEAFPDGCAVFDVERGQLTDIRPTLWQTDTSISRSSWGYVHEQDYRSAFDIIGDLVDVVSKNGTLLLNVGPRSDGTIPEQEQRVLLEIGRWLEINGEAIYGTRPWKRFGEGPTEVVGGSFSDTKREPYTGADVRFTTKGEILYAIVLGQSMEQITVKSLASGSELHPERIGSVRLLGSAESLTWRRDGDGLHVVLPEGAPADTQLALKIVKG